MSTAETSSFDLSEIRVALEHATFKDFRIRDGITTFIRAIELDLGEIGFEASEQTKEAAEELSTIVNDVETPLKIHNTPLELDETEVEVVERSMVGDDDTTTTPVINVDDELE